MSIFAQIDDLILDDSLVETLRILVDTPSPTGEEAKLAENICRRMAEFGVLANIQYFNDSQANAIGVLQGNLSAKKLMLYAPIDTVTSNRETEDLPWLGPELRNDMRANSYLDDDHVFGLGAHNPKGHAACIIEAARILQQLSIPNAGNIYFGFGAGGMPTHSREGFGHETGHGIGCEHLIGSLPKLDAAIIAKSGTSVTWEEVGFIWFEVTVEGKHNYVGARHLMPYDNAIANAAKLILEFEQWFEKYSERHKTDLCCPQGTVSFMQSGWKRMPAFTPQCAKFLIDLRFTPQQSADVVESELSAALTAFCEQLNIQARYRVTQTISPSHTSPEDPVIKSTISIWEHMHGRIHDAFKVMSGSTDANILRASDIPTARVGLAKAKRPDMDFALGMNCVAKSELRRLTKFLVLSVLHYFGEVGNG